MKKIVPKFLHASNFVQFCSFSPKYCIASMLNYVVMENRKSNWVKLKGLLG